MHSRLWNLGIGVTFTLASIVTLVWWIPNDVETGVLVQDRYAIEVGDAMAPTAVAVGILIISLALLLSAYFNNADAGADLLERSVGLTYANLLSLAASGAVLFVSLACMVWGGVRSRSTSFARLVSIFPSTDCSQIRDLTST